MKLAVKLLLLAVLLPALYTAAMYAVYSMPRTAVDRNATVAIHKLQDEWMGRLVLPDGFPAIISAVDTWTDSVMIMGTISSRPGHVMESAMLNYMVHTQPDPIAASSVDDDTEFLTWEKIAYARYWHGYLLMLRPALMAIDYYDLRVVHAVLLTVVLALCIVLAWRRLGRAAALSLLAILLLFNVYLVAVCLQFYTCVMLALLGMIAIMLFPRMVSTTTGLALTFYTLGSLTCFFDFLTAPVLPLGMCAIVALLLTRSEVDKKRLLLFIVAIWGAGYGITWASKWVIAQALTGYDVIGNALEQFLHRSSMGAADAEDNTGFTWSALFLVVEGLMVVAAIIYARMRSARGRRQGMGWLLGVALLPTVWYLCTLNHTIVHIYFVWRSTLCAFWAVTLYFWYTRRRKSSPAV